MKNLQLLGVKPGGTVEISVQTTAKLNLPEDKKTKESKFSVSSSSSYSSSFFSNSSSSAVVFSQSDKKGYQRQRDKIIADVERELTGTKFTLEKATAAVSALKQGKERFDSRAHL
ncbi:MAG TPA: hypothetical protein VHE99_01205 [Gammaproteobacteria bacterium]|nr:hypothetical protein [Gammaproteobacteria bacterium]